MWRWIEIDPWGHAIHCAEAVWRQKVEGERRDELIAHESAILEVIHDPDEVYREPVATERTRLLGNPDAEVVHFAGYGRCHGKFVGNAIVIVVKWLPEPRLQEVVGFVRSMWIADSLRLSKLQLQWRRA